MSPAVNASSDSTDALFNSERLIDVAIEIDPDDWNRLRLQHRGFVATMGKQRLDAPGPRPYTYFRADVTIDGARIESVGIRKKGFFGSANSRRPALKIKLHEYRDGQSFSGLRRMTLNNNNQDPSQVNQILAYSVFSDAGVPAPRCNLAKVTVNRQYLGIYTHVEPIRTSFLKRHFEDADGNLYEGAFTDFRPVWVETFLKKTKSDADRSDLIAVADALQFDDSKLLSELEKVVDIDAFLRFWAVEGLIGHWDGYSNSTNNFYVYNDARSKRFHFIPWGPDSCFGDEDPFVRYSPPESVKANGFLAHRLYNHPVTRKKYRQTMQQILDHVWSENSLLDEIDRIARLIQDHIHVDNHQFVLQLDKRRAFVRQRRGAVQAELDDVAPEWEQSLGAAPYIVKVGEVNSDFAAEWGEFSPDDVFSSGKANLAVELGGEVMHFSRVGVAAGPSPVPSRLGIPSVGIFGLRSGDGIPLWRWLRDQIVKRVSVRWLRRLSKLLGLRLTWRLVIPYLIIDPDSYSAGATVSLDMNSVFGVLVEGRPRSGDTGLTGSQSFLGFLADGKLELIAATTTAGNKVEGTLSTDVYSFPLAPVAALEAPVDNTDPTTEGSA